MSLSASLKRLLEEAKSITGVDGNVRILLYPMKHKLASISLKTRTIRLNKHIALKLSEETLRYVIVHELIHLKLKTVSHSLAFHKELEKIYPASVRERIERDIAGLSY